MSTASSTSMKLMTLARRFLLFVVLVIFLPIGLMTALGLGIVWDGISPHHGDGQFTDRSERLIGPFGTHYYSIQMPSFDMGNPIEETYSVSNLTPIPPKSGLVVFLGISENSPWDRNPTLKDLKLTGNFSILLKDSTGKLILQVQGDMSNCVWGGRGPGWQKDPLIHTHLLYIVDQNNCFIPNKKETYQIFFRYTPDKRLNGLKGFVCMLYNKL